MSVSEDVRELEQKCEAYRMIIKYCVLEDEEIFSRFTGAFRNIGVNKTLSYCPFPDSCKYYMSCDELYCPCTVCDNGYPRRE